MTVSVERVGEVVQVRLTGADALWSLKKELDLAVGDIERVSVQDVAVLKQALSWRTAGTYVPGVAACGHYAVRGRKGARQLWCVYKDKRVLVLDTRLERPWRVVLQVRDPDATAAALGVSTA